VKLSVLRAFVRKYFFFFTLSHRGHKWAQRENFVFYLSWRNKTF